MIGLQDVTDKRKYDWRTTTDAINETDIGIGLIMVVEIMTG